jgi:genome maintenance exonuclease 1
MTKKNFVQLDESKFPTTKGKNIDGFRFYAVEDKHFPSITTVLGAIPKPGLIAWRKNVGEEAAKWEMNRAARRGSATHTLVEQYLKGETPAIRDVLPLGMFRLLKPYLDQVDNIHALEKIMYSKKLTVAGQVDCIAEYNGKLSVIDFKTANKERVDSWNENYYIQCTAYAIMYEELFGTPIEQIVILQAGEDGSAKAFVKNKADYMGKLEDAIKGFYKYYEEKTGNKPS